MQAVIGFWSHALTAIAFASILLWRVTRPVTRPGQALMLAALALTACWAWLSGIQPGSALTSHSETARNLLWIGLLYALSNASDGRLRGVGLVYGAVAAVLGLQFVVTFLVGQSPSLDTLGSSEVLRTIAAAGSLILVHNLYAQSAPATRSALRFTMAGLAAMWLYDLNYYTVATLGDGARLSDWRGVMMLMIAPLFALGARDDQGAARIKLSRSASFQSLSILAICAYFALMVVLSTALRDSAHDWLNIVTVAMLALMTVAAMVVIPSARARGWIQSLLARHLFEHRYDYRSEWLRFSETLGHSDAGSAPLNERIIKAFADIFEAERGLLLTADEAVLSVSASLDWASPFPAADRLGDSARFWNGMEASARILELDALRDGYAKAGDKAVGAPAWLVEDPSLWIAIPLIHEGRMVGLVVLAAPAHRRPLDWEDFDLLKTAGRQAASSLADALGQEALATAQRFEEFNRRFAFILHDIKNLVSQMSLLARNAERHADNPEFRADMVATLQSSANRMTDLVTRLDPKGAPRVDAVEGQPLRALITDAIAASRGDREVELSGDCGTWAEVDAVALDKVLRNLIQNALEASPLVEPVHVRVSRSGDQVSIAIIDQGCGMDSDFVRNRLFQPFASTKSNGFGIGAFEARSLVTAMGGRLVVDSKPGRGTSFTILLPAAEPKSSAERKRA
jgi:putative PEP-CTERM system histidine kinase